MTPNLRVLVLDSSAMLAYLNGEPEGVVVAGLFKSPDVLCYAHSINLAEVFYDFGPPSVPANLRDAQNALVQLRTVCRVQERNDLDEAFWQDVALLVAERRAMPREPTKPKQVPRLALGDAFGLALSRRLSGEFVSKDRTEIEPMQDAGFCRALFIR